MTSAAKRNLPASVRQRLLNLSAERHTAFELVLIRYGIERLLFRLSHSNYSDRFLLKGAMLFAVWNPEAHRPTRDVDLLGFGPSELTQVEAEFREICEVPVEDDGLAFDPKSVGVEEIREDARYAGLRVTLVAKLGRVRIPVQVDIGYGDAVTPGPQRIEFPTLLDFPAPKLNAYPIYTVVAEKLEAIASLGEINTRMKDFYDLWFLSERFDFEGTPLALAIRATFRRRQTQLPAIDSMVGLTQGYADGKRPYWNAFLQRNGLEALRLDEVIRRIRTFLSPVVADQVKPSDGLTWKASKGWTR